MHDTPQPKVARVSPTAVAANVQSESAACARSQKRWDRACFLTVCVFFVAGLISLDQFGATWDEFQSISAGDANIEFLSIASSEAPPHHFPPGYYFAIDTMRAAFAKAVLRFSDWPDQVIVFHFFHLLLSTSCLALLVLVVRSVSGQPRLALFTVCAMALLPQFVGHSQNNPKDLPALFSFLLATYFILKSVMGKRSRWAWLAAASLGFAFTTRLLAMFLVPILLFFFLFRWRERFLQRWRRIALICCGGVVAAFAFWPWLWDSPLQKLSYVKENIGLLFPETYTMYLGEVYLWNEVPWHYLIVELMVSLPVGLVPCLLLSIPAIFCWRTEAVPKADVACLGVIWTVGLLVADQLSPHRYDGIRHFLPILAGMSMLIGCGADYCVDLLTRAAERSGPSPLKYCLVWSLPTVFAVATLLELAFQHPYETAYVNPVASWLVGRPTERFLEVEYWGNAYKEGAAWINKHAERDAVVYEAPIGTDILHYYVKRPVLPSEAFGAFEDQRVPKYVMFITRNVWYDELISNVEREYQPVFKVERQHATLLKIYCNRSIESARRRSELR